MTNDASDDDMLRPSEATDSDELRNDDGDEVVAAPDQWQAADDPALLDEPTDGQSLDDRLAAEEPEVGDAEVEASRHRGQVSGSPEDGGSFYSIEE
jgi:hypothetical protein